MASPRQIRDYAEKAVEQPSIFQQTRRRTTSRSAASLFIAVFGLAKMDVVKEWESEKKANTSMEHRAISLQQAMMHDSRQSEPRKLCG